MLITDPLCGRTDLIKYQVVQLYKGWDLMD